jgi:DUF917 family protein
MSLRIEISDLPDLEGVSRNPLVIPAAMMGAPTWLIEKLTVAPAISGPRTFGLGVGYRQSEVFPGSKLPRTTT